MTPALIAFLLVGSYIWLMCIAIIMDQKGRVPGSKHLGRLFIFIGLYLQARAGRKTGTPYIMGPDNDMVTIRRWRRLSFVYVVSIYFMMPSGNMLVRHHLRFRGYRDAQLLANYLHLYHCILWENREQNCEAHLPVWQEAVQNRRDAIKELKSK